MKLNFIDRIIKFFNWFVDFLAKPLGIAIWSIVLILSGVYYGNYQREIGTTANKEKMHADENRIILLEKKIDTLSNRLMNKDCTDEVQKYINLIQTLQIQTSQNKEEVKKRLELEKKKTEELESLNKSLYDKSH
jgi:hypothetical protein